MTMSNESEEKKTDFQALEVEFQRVKMFQVVNVSTSKWMFNRKLK